jgi:DNA-binding NarL/FixJ family response regulator
MTKARICIAEDVQLFREGLVNLINQQPDLEIIGEAEDGLEILSLARDLKPDLILMDINMPICDGIEATALVHEMFPDMTILILTSLEDDEKLLKAVKAGASGYLLKSASSQGFLRSIRGALDGEAILPRKLSIRLLEEYVAASRELNAIKPGAHSPTLTFREIEVLRFIARGLTNQEIADTLNVSVYTIKSHVRNLIDKLGAKNRWNAVAIAKESGFIHVEPEDQD